MLTQVWLIDAFNHLFNIYITSMLYTVLGASDSENCTYQLGYVGRQALYSCKTCFEKSGVKAGICLACSLKCHDGHDLFELYTKRNFRCDCGLKDKFPETECELDLVSMLIRLDCTLNYLFRPKVDRMIGTCITRTLMENIARAIALTLIQITVKMMS